MVRKMGKAGIFNSLLDDSLFMVAHYGSANGLTHYEGEAQTKCSYRAWNRVIT